MTTGIFGCMTMQDKRLTFSTLEKPGRAQSYDISTTFRVRPISGWINISGSPAPRAHLIFDD